MDRTSSGGHRVEEKDQGEVEGKGTSSGETGGGVGKWSKTRTRWTETRCTTEVEQGQRHGRRGALVLLAMFGHTSITLYC